MIELTIDKKPRQRWIELHPECTWHVRGLPNGETATRPRWTMLRICSRCRRNIAHETAHLPVFYHGVYCAGCCPACSPKRADADPRVCSRCRRTLEAEITYIVLGLDGLLCRDCCRRLGPRAKAADRKRAKA